MNKKQQEALRNHVLKSGFVKKMSIEVKKTGYITFQYELENEHHSYSPSVEAMCDEEIEQSKKNIEFYTKLKNMK